MSNHLIDVSRLVWGSWTRRLQTGIDRVAEAYLRYFADSSRAVVQYRGINRILTKRHSQSLFALLLEGGPDRRKIAALAPAAFAASQSRPDQGGAFYFNVGHTDIDLPRHIDWVRNADLRPIYMIHDLIPVNHSEFCRPQAQLRHRRRVENALTWGTGIIANSAATLAELERFAQANALRQPPMVAALLAGAKLSRLDVVPLNAIPHFVYVSTIEGRKNHFMLLQVWCRLIERLGPQTPRLIMIGQAGALADHVYAMLEHCSPLRNHVTVLEHCSDTELSLWVGTARALLFPSLAEGFGMPLVEALELGTPVIASDLAPFREVGAGIPTLLDPLDAPAWEEAILSFLGNGPERSRQLRLLKSYQAPTWQAHFAQVESWLSTLEGDPKSDQVRMAQMKPVDRLQIGLGQTTP